MSTASFQLGADGRPRNRRHLSNLARTCERKRGRDQADRTLDRHLVGWVSLTHYHAVVTPPFTGGLFLGSTAIQAFSRGSFVIDRDYADYKISRGAGLRPAHIRSPSAPSNPAAV